MDGHKRKGFIGKIWTGREAFCYSNESNFRPHNEVTHSLRVLHMGNYSWNGCGLWTSLFLSLLFACANCQIESNNCAPGLKTPGRTWPREDIVLEYNQPLRIYCMLDERLTDPKYAGKNASDIVFFRNRKAIEPEYVTIVNSTTSLLHMENLAPSDDIFDCRLRLNEHSGPKYEAVCQNKVIVGFKPQEPRNFSCVSRNWENLICTWDPEPNHIPTRFFLTYKFPGRVGGRFRYPCPKPRHDLPPNTCLWDSTTDPIYRQVSPDYIFMLQATNILGSRTFNYSFHHWAHVIPSKPENLTVVDKTYSSVELSWAVPYWTRNFPPGFFHRISYQSQYDSTKLWKVIEIQGKKHAKNIHFNLTDLPYANTAYDIRVFTKSVDAIGEDKWSEFSDITVKTKATVPGRPPRTDIGSFEIVENYENRDVYIYWQTIPAKLENGDNLTYQVVGVEENGDKSDIQPSEITKSYAKFRGISFESFKFEIVAANSQGASKQNTLMIVPHRTDMPRNPTDFTIVEFDNSLYELSWIPDNHSNITSYTIFWCETNQDRPHQCNGYFDWMRVSRDISAYNFTVPDAQKNYQFAIAANTEHSSSGMTWNTCRAVHNVLGKLNSLWINTVTSNIIQVGWQLECSDRTNSVEGFVVHYCPIVSPYNRTCKYPMMHTTVVGDRHTSYANLRGLTPYTTYMFSIAILTKYGESRPSDLMYNTTLEAAPTQPQSVVVTNITDTTVSVEWQPPTHMNGVLRYYTVYYNGNSVVVEWGNSVELQGLQPDTRYDISVSALTVTESERSLSISCRTLGGIPGRTHQPRLLFNTVYELMLSWTNTDNNFNYYKIITADNITTLEKAVGITGCNDAGRRKVYQFRVRSVLIENDEKRYKGPWSDPAEASCSSN